MDMTVSFGQCHWSRPAPFTMPMMLSRAHAGSVGQASTTTARSVPVAAIRALRAAPGAAHSGVEL